MIIYLDMDGVLADFDRGAKAFGFDTTTLNHSRSELNQQSIAIKETLYDAIAFTEFYAELPFMPDGLELWNALRGYRPFILTGLPSFRHRVDAKAAHEDAGEKKRQWCRKYLGLHDQERVICTLSWKKKSYVGHHGPAEYALLIDDRERNITEWKEAGGVGLLHRSTSKTLEELQLLLGSFNS